MGKHKEVGQYEGIGHHEGGGPLAIHWVWWDTGKWAGHRNGGGHKNGGATEMDRPPGWTGQRDG